MLKTLIASGVAVSAVVLGSPAIAGPYVNVENNAGFAGGDGLDMDFVDRPLTSTLVLKVATKLPGISRAGPALISPDGGDADVEFSGKIGGSVVVSADEKLSIYGEISFITVDDFDAANVGTKIGAKYSF